MFPEESTVQIVEVVDENVIVPIAEGVVVAVTLWVPAISPYFTPEGAVPNAIDSEPLPTAVVDVEIVVTPSAAPVKS